MRMQLGRKQPERLCARSLKQTGAMDGAAIKKRIDSKYKIGIVWWKGDDNKWNKVAEWKDEQGKMVLMPAAVRLQGPFDVLMG